MISRAFDGQPEGLTRDDVLDNITLTWLQTREAEMALARILDGPLIRRVEGGENGRQYLGSVKFLGNDQCPDGEGRYSVLVLHAARVGVPVVLTSSRFRRFDDRP